MLLPCQFSIIPQTFNLQLKCVARTFNFQHSPPPPTVAGCQLRCMRWTSIGQVYTSMQIKQQKFYFFCKLVQTFHTLTAKVSGNTTHKYCTYKNIRTTTLTSPSGNKHFCIYFAGNKSNEFNKHPQVKCGQDMSVSLFSKLFTFYLQI